MGRSTIIAVRDKKIEHLTRLLQNLEPDIIARAKTERTSLLQYFNEKGLNQINRQAVVDIGYGGSVQRDMNKVLSQKVHGYYLLTDERSDEIVNAYKVIIRSCFFGRTEQPHETSIMYRSSFELEKLLSDDEPQIEYYLMDSRGNVEGHFRDLSPVENESSGIRKQLQEGAMDYIRDARHLRETMLPDFQPSCWTAQMLMETFLDSRSQAEADLLSKIVLDDHYCGRDLVTRGNTWDF
jgi:hypothetical protein